jgi:hypothetical protein
MKRMIEARQRWVLFGPAQTTTFTIRAADTIVDRCLKNPGPLAYRVESRAFRRARCPPELQRRGSAFDPRLQLDEHTDQLW